MKMIQVIKNPSLMALLHNGSKAYDESGPNIAQATIDWERLIFVDHYYNAHGLMGLNPQFSVDDRRYWTIQSALYDDVVIPREFVLIDSRTVALWSEFTYYTQRCEVVSPNSFSTEANPHYVPGNHTVDMVLSYLLACFVGRTPYDLIEEPVGEESLYPSRKVWQDTVAAIVSAFSAISNIAVPLVYHNTGPLTRMIYDEQRRRAVSPPAPTHTPKVIELFPSSSDRTKH